MIPDNGFQALMRAEAKHIDAIKRHRRVVRAMWLAIALVVMFPAAALLFA